MPEPSELPPPQFEQAIAELDGILRELEDGTTTLEDALARYERGVSLLRQCYGQLRAAEQRVKVLAGVSEDGADLKPFDHVAAIDTAKAAVRKSPATARGSAPQSPPDPGIPE